MSYAHSSQVYLEPRREANPEHTALTGRDSNRDSLRTATTASHYYEEINNDRNSPAANTNINNRDERGRNLVGLPKRRVDTQSKTKRACRYVCFGVWSVIVFSVGMGTAWVILKSMGKIVDQSRSIKDNKESEDINECLINKGGCAHVCTNNEGSFTCSCNPGYQLMGDRKGCQDVDECSVNNGGCNHICFNNQGSFTCDCSYGYQLIENRKECQRRLTLEFCC